MKNGPLVSVIVPAFNCEGFILEAIESIVNQTYPNVEILVCDDASTDRTWSNLQGIGDSRLKLFRNVENVGVVPTKNFLLSKAQGEFIVFQDADDSSHPRRIEKLLQQFNEDPELAACASDFATSRSKNAELAESFKKTYITLPDCLTLEIMPFTIMVKKVVCDKTGGFNMIFNRMIAEDLYWLFTIAEQYKLLIIDLPLYYYRYNIHSLTNSFKNPDKLVAIELVKELALQRIASAEDWIIKGDTQSIRSFIKRKLKDRDFLAEQYRLAAARLRDGRRFWEAFVFIMKAIWLRPGRTMNYRTLRYVITPF